MRRVLPLILSFLFMPSAWSAMKLNDEGTLQGYVNVLNCVGTDLTCTASGITGTLTEASSATATGWTKTGANVTLTTSTDNAGLGTATMTGKGRLFKGGGTAIVTTDWALANWGAGATVSAVTGNDSRGTVTVLTSALDTPLGTPTLTLTFKDLTWTSVPFSVVCMNDSSTGTLAAASSSTTVTTLRISYVGTPPALTAANYVFNYWVEG